MKINKNTTLAFVGGVLLASSASMFAATNINTDNTIDTNMSMSATSTREHEGMKSDKMHRRHKKIDKMANLAHKAQHDTDLASVLGISVDTLHAKLAASTTMDQMIKDAGMTKEEVHVKMQGLKKAEMESELAARVTSGKITQAQADKIKLRMTNMASNTQMRHDMMH